MTRLEAKGEAAVCSVAGSDRNLLSLCAARGCICTEFFLPPSTHPGPTSSGPAGDLTVTCVWRVPTWLPLGDLCWGAGVTCHQDPQLLTPRNLHRLPWPVVQPWPKGFTTDSTSPETARAQGITGTLSSLARPEHSACAHESRHAAGPGTLSLFLLWSALMQRCYPAVDVSQQMAGEACEGRRCVSGPRLAMGPRGAHPSCKC